MVEAVLDLVEDLGFPADEVIPGLMASVMTLASDTSNPSQALDEAVGLLDA